MNNILTGNKLTIIILSKDKNLVLEKLIKFWSSNGFRLLVLHETRSPLNISSQDSSVLYFPSGDPLLERLRRISAFVETDYVLISPDDEVFSITSITNGIRFLDENPDFSTISGQCIAISKYGNQCSYSYIYSYYLGYETLTEDPLSRMRESSEKTDLAMGVGAPYRIMSRELFLNFMAAIEELSPLNCTYSFEVLAEVYQNIHGKVKIQNNLFWIRNWITPAASDTKRNFYYFQWWESPEYKLDRRILTSLICKQYPRLTLKDINVILNIAYQTRKKRELEEYMRLRIQQKKLSSIKKKITRIILIQKMNFLFKPNTLESLQIQLDKNQIQYNDEELLALTKLVKEIA
jgi:hypothetical protein